MDTPGIESSKATNEFGAKELNKNNFGNSSVSVRKGQNKAESPAKTSDALSTKNQKLSRRNSISKLPTLESSSKNKPNDGTSKTEPEKKAETPKESNKDRESSTGGGAAISKASNVKSKDEKSPAAPDRILFKNRRSGTSRYNIRSEKGADRTSLVLYLSNSSNNRICVDKDGKVIEGENCPKLQKLVDEFFKNIGKTVGSLLSDEYCHDYTFHIKNSELNDIFKEMDRLQEKYIAQWRSQFKRNKTENKPKNQSNNFSSIGVDKEKTLSSVSESGNQPESKNSQPVDDAKEKAVIPQLEEPKNTGKNKTAEVTKEEKNEEPESEENSVKEDSVKPEQEENPAEKGNLNSEDTAVATKVKNPEDSEEAKSMERGTEGSTGSGNEVKAENDTSLKDKTEDGSKDQEKEIKDETNAPKEPEKIEDSTSAETSRIHPENEKADVSSNEILCDYSEEADTRGKIKCKVFLSHGSSEGTDITVMLTYDNGSIFGFSKQNGDINDDGTLTMDSNHSQDIRRLSQKGKKLVKTILEKRKEDISNSSDKKDKDFFGFLKNDLLIDESYIKDFFETEDTNDEDNNSKVGAENPENLDESSLVNDNTNPKNGVNAEVDTLVSPNESGALPSSTENQNVTEKPNVLPENAEVASASDEIVHDLDGNGNTQDKVECSVSISSWGNNKFKVSIKTKDQGNIDIFVDSDVAFNHDNPNLKIKEVRYASKSNEIPLETIKQTSAAQELVNKIFGNISDINSSKDISSLNFGDSLKKKFAISKSDIEGVIKPKDATAAERINAGQVAEGQALGNETNVKPLNFSELCEAAKINGSILLRPRDTVGAKIRNFFFNIFMGLAALFRGEKIFNENEKTLDKLGNALDGIFKQNGVKITNKGHFVGEVIDTPRDGNCMLWSAVASLSDFNLPSPSKSELSEARNLVIPYLRSEIAEEKGTTDTKRADKLRRRVGVGAESIEPAEMGPVAEALKRDIVIISDPDGKGSQPTLLLHTSDGELISSQNEFFNEDDATRIMEALNEGIVIYAAKGHARAVNISGLQYEIDNGSNNNPSNKTLNEASKPTNEDFEAGKGSPSNTNSTNQSTEPNAETETDEGFVFVGKSNND